MNFTWIVAAVLLGLGAASAPIWRLLLGVCLRKAIADERSRGRAWIAAIVSAAILTAISLAWWFAKPGDVNGFLIASAIAAVAAFVLPPLAIKAPLRSSLASAARGWATVLVVAVAVAIPIVGAIGSLTTDVYKVPSCNMAPTILGWHWTGACAECGEPAYCAAPDPDDEFMLEALEDHPDRDVICRHFHRTEISITDTPIGTGDRIIAARYRKPKRWDVIVFQLPEIPSVMYVMRLVGLPGETITIRDGAVWANGVRLEPPESIRGIEYADTVFEDPGWGSTEKPAVLADDEYFVLGDNTYGSKDSRFWELGAEGRPTYAVPESHLRGVVTHTYWPPSRWREF